jgi:glycosyltransferase involved in cell wall biosynthesis
VLDSTQGQTIRAIAILVVDDASTDSWPVVVESYSNNDAQIRLIRRVRNSATRVAPIIGIEHARGIPMVFLGGAINYVVIMPLGCGAKFRGRSHASATQAIPVARGPYALCLLIWPQFLSLRNLDSGAVYRHAIRLFNDGTRNARLTVALSDKEVNEHT